MIEKKEHFGDRVRRLLKERGKTSTDLEIETGMARRILYKFYDNRPTRSTLMALAYYLGVTVEELVDGTDQEDAWYR